MNFLYSKSLLTSIPPTNRNTGYICFHKFCENYLFERSSKKHTPGSPKQSLFSFTAEPGRWSSPVLHFRSLYEHGGQATAEMKTGDVCQLVVGKTSLPHSSPTIAMGMGGWGWKAVDLTTILSWPFSSPAPFYSFVTSLFFLSPFKDAADLPYTIP